MVLPIIAAIGVGLSAAGTIASLNAQRNQARAQEEASLQSALDAEERIELALRRAEAIKASAKIIRDRELSLISAQRKQAELSVIQQTLANRLAQIQTQAQTSQLRGQGEAARLEGEATATQTVQGAESEAFEIERGAANQLFGRQNEIIGTLGQEAQAGLAGANALAQARQGLTEAEGVQNQVTSAGRSNTLAGQAATEQALLAAQGNVGNVRMANQQAMGVAAQNTQSAMQSADIAQRQLELARRYGLTNLGLAQQNAQVIRGMGTNQQFFANLGANQLETEQRYADVNLTQSADTQREINRIQAKRNRSAVRAGYQSTLATQNLAALSQVLQEQSSIAQAQAQASMVQRPGIGQYFGVLAGGVNAAYQLGLFNPGQSSTISHLPPSGAATRPQPTVTFGQPLRINQYPPGYAPSNPNLINTYPPGY